MDSSKTRNGKMTSFPTIISDQILPFLSAQTLRAIANSDLEPRWRRPSISRLHVLEEAKFQFSLRGAERAVIDSAESRSSAFGKRINWGQWQAKDYKNTTVISFTVKGSTDAGGDEDASSVPVEEMLKIAKLAVDRHAENKIVDRSGTNNLVISNVSRPEEAAIVAALARTISPSFKSVDLRRLQGCADGINTLLGRVVSSGDCWRLRISDCDVDADTKELVKKIAKQKQLKSLYLSGATAGCSLEFWTEIVEFFAENAASKRFYIDAANREVKEKVRSLVANCKRRASRLSITQARNPAGLLVEMLICPDRKRETPTAADPISCKEPKRTKINNCKKQTKV